jgi:hypothetical protein
MGSGYWIAECVEAAGGEMICGKMGGNSAVLDGPERLLEADFVILAPCGFSIERTKAELDAIGLLEDPVFADLPAVKSGRCFVADGNKYFNRSSCGVIETAEMVAEMLHPDLTGLWGHHGERFVKLNEMAAFCERPGAPAISKPIPGPDPSHGYQSPPEKFQGHSLPTKLASSCGKERLAMTSKDVVKAQLEALQAADFDTAFELNSAKNKARLGSAKKFESIVRGSSFNILLSDQTRLTVHAPVEGDQLGSTSDSVAIRIDAVGPDSEATFHFDLGKVGPDSAWATEGVRVECS